jgi:hypothetical protein
VPVNKRGGGGALKNVVPEVAERGCLSAGANRPLLVCYQSIEILKYLFTTKYTKITKNFTI